MTTVNWKREPLVWMIILIPFSAVVMGVILITLAIKSETGLVTDDYYKKGKEINRVLARNERAATLQLHANVTMDKSLHRLYVTLESKTGTALPTELTVNFFHATRPGEDQSILLHQTENGLYQGTFDPLALGRWNVQLETPTWRLIGSKHVPGSVSLQLSPGL